MQDNLSHATKHSKPAILVSQLAVETSVTCERLFLEMSTFDHARLWLSEVHSPRKNISFATVKRDNSVERLQF